MVRGHSVSTTPKQVEEVRFQIIWNSIFGIWSEFKPDMVMIESAIGGSRTQHGTQRLNAVVCWEFFKLDVAFETMAPNTLKKAATGNGRADKPEMLAAARRHWPECPNDDCADAYWLAIEATKVRTEGV